ncbi:pilus assembly protein [Arenimonas sp.]|uniref:pilus assembly protein n=1 Tax=Arenimonas sp. TaxID=1872635 RepID=UPI0039E48E87
MNTSRNQSSLAARLQRHFRRASPIAAAFAATLISLPGAAVDIPNTPLQSGASFPAPNIMFILDDSGSMDFTYMPDALASVGGDNNVRNAAYPHNPMAYNPAVTYKAWIKADNTRYTTGTTYTSAWGDISNLSSSTNLSSSAQYFYIAKTGATPLTSLSSYWRYEIVSGGSDIRKGEYGTAVVTVTTPADVNLAGYNPFNVPETTTNVGGSNDVELKYDITVPTPAAGHSWESMVVTLTGGTHGDNGSHNNNNGDGANLYVHTASDVRVNNYTCRSIGGGNDESCTIDSPDPVGGNHYWIGINRASSFGGVQLRVVFKYKYNYTTNRCDGDDVTGSAWINCVSELPSTRNLTDEKNNYATWYSYHRSRLKVAKAGASEAFSQIGTNARMGFDTIWNDPDAHDDSVATNATPVYPIPVGSDGGLFRNTTTPTVSNNRTTWFNYLHGAVGDNGTPLKGALQRAGRYFTDSANTGPWGPAAQISCRQAFAILTTDGYWNNNAGYTAIGDADSDTSTSESVNPTIPNPSGSNYKYAPINPYKDNVSPTRLDTLADVAMYYWKRDLMSTLTNDVPASAADPAYWQHMVTFGISIGLQGNLNPSTDLPSITNGSVKWTNPLDAEDDDRIDDLWHASVNGHGSFVAATSPAAFAQALLDALSLIAARRGSGSNVATNSTSFQDNTRVFQARYLTGNWTGELAAYAATSAGVAAEPSWQASQGIPAYGSRKVFTWNGTAGAAFPTATQLTTLDQSARPLSSVNGTDNANYIKGQSTKERRFDGGTLRSRTVTIRSGGADIVAGTPMGDIVNSSPIYVSELSTIFVGANDGMLHAINAATGAEHFAYIPAGINMTALGGLSDPQYAHGYFVDGPIAVSTTKQTPGHNYLVGALGRGGKGVYGLEVKTPASFAATDVLWERTTGANMGYVLGEPLVVTLNDGSKGVIVSNGINSTNGKAVLFILNIATGAIIKEIDTGVAGDNGLFAPRGWDNDNNGTVDYVYAGDLKGNLWKFDLTSNLTTNWQIALSGNPLFVAKDASNVRQPITAGLALALEPLSGRRWVFLATGRFLSTTDMSDMSVQSTYGIIDDGLADVDSRTGVAAFGELEKRSILVASQIRLDTDGDGDTNQLPAGTDNLFRDVRGFQPNATLPAGKKGWFIDMVKPPTPTAEGERTVSNPRVFGTVLVTASLIPPTNNTCDAGGNGYINALDAFTGTSLTQAFFNANLTKTGGAANFADDTLTSGSDTVAIGSVDLGLGMPTLPTLIDQLLVAGGSTGTLGSISINPQGNGSRRLSWREILKD